MKTLLLLAALSTATPAFAEDDTFDLSPPSSWDVREICGEVVNPPDDYEDGYLPGKFCIVVAAQFLERTARWNGPHFNEDGMDTQIVCAASIILRHADDERSVRDILNAEFDAACQPATM